MKTWKKALLGLLLFLVLLWLAAMMRGGTLIRQAINTVGPQLLGVPVTVGDVTYLPLRGLVQLQDLHIGNPPGYQTPGAFDLGRLDVNFRTTSLFSKPIIIDAVKVEQLVVTYERGAKNSNIGEIQARLDGGKDEEESEESKVIIRDLLIAGAKVNVSIAALKGEPKSFSVPTIHLTDIGKGTGGAQVKEVLKKVIDEVLAQVLSVTADFRKTASEAASKGLKKASEAVGKLGDKIGNLFKKK